MKLAATLVSAGILVVGLPTGFHQSSSEDLDNRLNVLECQVAQYEDGSAKFQDAEVAVACMKKYGVYKLYLKHFK